jgi:hypothetical protein
MDPITLDLVLTVTASSALIGSSAFALCLLPRTSGEAAAVGRILAGAPAWCARVIKKGLA